MPRNTFIAFMDIDGVLMRYHESKFSAAAVESLEMLRDAGAIFVLHSTWRCNLEMLKAAHGLFNAAYCNLHSITGPNPSKRIAIIEWLEEHYGDQWPPAVVFDDHLIESIEGVQIIRVDPSTGLTTTIIRECLESLVIP